jgi:hypothetical protein
MVSQVQNAKNKADGVLLQTSLTKIEMIKAEYQ